MSKQSFITLAVSWWCIWINRNQKLFNANMEDKIEDLSKYIHNMRQKWRNTKLINEDTLNIQNAPIKNKKTRRKRMNMTWRKPNHNHYKINFDGAVNSNNQAAMGFIIRDHIGKIIYMDNSTENNISVLQAETTALRMAIKKADRKSVV